MANEEEEKELKDLIMQTLEVNGVLSKIKAQIRASVFQALDDTEKHTQTKSINVDNKIVKKLLQTKEGRSAISLVREFLQMCNLDYTLCVFDPEINANVDFEDRETLARNYNVDQNEQTRDLPLIYDILKARNTPPPLPTTAAPSYKQKRSKSAAEELSPLALLEAKKKFDYYDRNKNGIIDRNEFKQIFMDLHPNFPKSTIDHYLHSEFDASDRDLDNGINFDEFTSIYKRWFLLCRSVVAQHMDKDDLPSDRSEKSVVSLKNSVKSTTSTNGHHKLIDVNKFDAKQNKKKNDLIDIEDDLSSSSSSSLTEKMGKQTIKPNTEKNTNKNEFDLNNDSNKANKLIDFDDDFLGFNIKKNNNEAQLQKSSNFMSNINKNDAQNSKTSLKDAPSLFTKTNQANFKDIDRKMKGLGFADEEDNYDDDFTSGTTPRTSHSTADKRRVKNRNPTGSEEEIEENISYADESSKFDEITNDKTISTIQGNNDADYIEDLSN